MALRSIVSDQMKAKAMQALAPNPELYMRAKAIYHGRSVYRGIRLNCYAPGKTCFSKFVDLGAGADELEVESIFTSVNMGTERAMFFRYPNTQAKFPYTPMAAGVGRVTKVGRKLRGQFKTGDLVAGALRHQSSCVIPGVQASKIVDKAHSLEGYSLMHLAIIAIQGLRMPGLKKGDRVLVLGQGVIGRLASLIARAMGAEVLCAARSRKKLDQFGESQGIATESPDSLQRAVTFSPNIILDVTGDPEAIHWCVQVSPQKSKIVLLGSSRGLTKNFDISSSVLSKELEIMGAHIKNISQMPKNYAQEGAFIQELVVNGALNLEDCISKKLVAEDFDSFYSNELNNSYCGVSVDWRQSSNLSSKLEAELPEPRIEVGAELDQKLGMALIGCGDITRMNARAAVDSKAIEVVAAMDVNLENAQKTASSYGAKACGSLDELLSVKAVDAVLVAVPHFLHRDISLACAQAKKNILLEKPIARNLAEAREILEACESNNVGLRTFYPFELEPMKQEFGFLLERACVGKVYGISIEVQRFREMSYWFGAEGLSWRGQLEGSGGGFAMMYFIHIFDFIQRCMGVSIEEVFAFCDTKHHPIEVEDHMGLSFKGSQGEIGTVSGSSATQGHGGSGIRVWGENGQILMSEKDIQFYSTKPVGQYKEGEWHQIKSSDLNSMLLSRCLFLRDFAEDIQSKSLKVEYRGLEALAVVEAIYQSKKTGQKERVLLS